MLLLVVPGLEGAAVYIRAAVCITGAYFDLTGVAGAVFTMVNTVCNIACNALDNMFVLVFHSYIDPFQRRVDTK